MAKSLVKSIAAVGMGFAAIVVLSYVTDTTLQSVGVLPITGAERFGTGQAVLALSYHLAYAFGGCYLAARLAPSRPVVHAMVLGGIGVLMSARPNRDHPRQPRAGVVRRSTSRIVSAARLACRHAGHIKAQALRRLKHQEAGPWRAGHCCLRRAVPAA